MFAFTLRAAVVLACCFGSAGACLSTTEAAGFGGLPEPGKGAQYWDHHSVVYAELLSISPARGATVDAVIDPLGTLAGSFDSGIGDRVSVHDIELAPWFPYVEDAKENRRSPTKKESIEQNAQSNVSSRSEVIIVDPQKDRMPKEGDKVLLILSDLRPPIERRILAGGRVAFMPGWWHQPLRIITGFEDDDVTSVMHAIREIRGRDATSAKTHQPSSGDFWESHSVVYGDLGGTQSNNRSLVIEFRPKISLAGNFDCGTDTARSIFADPVDFEPPRKPVPIGARALVLLGRKDSSWMLSRNESKAIFGIESSILPVTSFADRSVSDVREKIQKSRARLSESDNHTGAARNAR